MRVLVVDDNPLNASLLTAQLVGHDVVACHDGLTALAELLRQDFDAVLLDLLMPPPDGLETCRLMRATDRCAHVPVLFVTALHGPEIRDQVFEAGGDDLLTKPVSQEEVLRRLETVVAACAAQRGRERA